MGHFLRILGLAAFFTLMFTAFNNCGAYRFEPNVPIKKSGGGTTVGNPVQAVETAFGAWGEDLMVKNDPRRWFDYLIPRAHAQSIEDFMVVMCLYEIKFFPKGGGLYEEFELVRQQVELKPEGVTLGQFAVTPGEYERVQVEMKGEACGGTKRTALVQNPNGDFESYNELEINFNGPFTYVDGKLDIDLKITDLMVILYGISDNGKIDVEVNNYDGNIELK